MSKPTEENFLKLDVRYLQKAGGLRKGGRIILTWWHTRRDGLGERRKSGEVKVAAFSDSPRYPDSPETPEGGASSIVLLYSVGGVSANPRVVIEWERLALNRGDAGSRPWFRCSGCGARVGCLFFPYRFRVTHETPWRCRSCWGMCYATQKLAPELRLQRRVFRAFDAIGYEGSIVYPPLLLGPDDPLPAGMSWWKYLEKWRAAINLWRLYHTAMGARFERRWGFLAGLYQEREELLTDPPKGRPGRPKKVVPVLVVSVCGAKTRKGSPCQCKPEPGKRRCKLHGGKSTGPKSAAGREAIRESNRQRSIDASHSRSTVRALLSENPTPSEGAD